MRTHRIGSPGSVARYLDDHAHDANAKPFPAPWCVFTYKATGGILFCGSAEEREGAECVRGAAEQEHGWAVTVDVRTYGCRVFVPCPRKSWVELPPVSKRDSAKGDGSSSGDGKPK